MTNSDSVTGVVSSEGSGSDLTSKSIVTLTNNNFQENGESGLKLINYNFPVKAEENIFRENCEHGIFVDLDYRNTSSTNSNTWTSTMSERIKTFSAVESTTAYDYLPEAMLPSYANNVVNASSINYDFTSFTDVSTINTSISNLDTKLTNNINTVNTTLTNSINAVDTKVTNLQADMGNTIIKIQSTQPAAVTGKNVVWIKI